MRIGDKNYQTIWYDEEDLSVKIIDQTKLPHEFIIKDIHKKVRLINLHYHSCQNKAEEVINKDPQLREILKMLNDIDLRKLSKLNLEKPNLRKFPVIKVFKKINSKTSLFETLIVSTNDTLVDLFLEKKIKFSQIAEIFFSTINEKKF